MGMAKSDFENLYSYHFPSYQSKEYKFSGATSHTHYRTAYSFWIAS